jgi:cell shape-determining protein MreC
MNVKINRYQSYREIFVLIGIILSVGAIEWLGLASPVQKGVQIVAQPIMGLSAQAQQILFRPLGVLTTRYTTMNRVSELEHQLNDALAQISALEQVKEENAQLRQALGAQSRPQRTVIGTPIVSYGLPTISVGSDEGVSQGSPVIASDTLVAIVDVVSPRQSTVAVLSQSNSTAVVARTEQGVEGLIVGDGKRILFTEIPRDKELKPGERIVTAGQQRIPANIFLGTVSQVVSEQSAPVQTVIVEQLQSFYDVPVVEVLP